MAAYRTILTPNQQILVDPHYGDARQRIDVTATQVLRDYGGPADSFTLYVPVATCATNESERKSVYMFRCKGLIDLMRDIRACGLLWTDLETGTDPNSPETLGIGISEVVRHLKQMREQLETARFQPGLIKHIQEHTGYAYGPFVYYDEWDNRVYKDDAQGRLRVWMGEECRKCSRSLVAARVDSTYAKMISDITEPFERAAWKVSDAIRETSDISRLGIEWESESLHLFETYAQYGATTLLAYRLTGNILYIKAMAGPAATDSSMARAYQHNELRGWRRVFGRRWTYHDHLQDVADKTPEQVVQDVKSEFESEVTSALADDLRESMTSGVESTASLHVLRHLAPDDTDAKALLDYF